MDFPIAPGLEVRRPTLADAPAIFALLAAADVVAIGRVDSTLEDIQDSLVEREFDPLHDGWLVRRREQLVGWAWACRKGDSDHVETDVYAHPQVDSIVPFLWDAVEERAGEIAAELGHPAALAEVGVYRQDARKRAIAEQRGYAVETSFYRMRVDQDKPSDHLELPAGIRLTTAGEDDELRRQAHEVYERSFVENFGFVPRSYEDWLADKTAMSTFDWSQLRLAVVDGVPAAMLAGTNQFVSDENCGYVQTLATLPAYRGRGLAQLLLRDRFAQDTDLGRTATYLHVDANNSTGALNLYESVGMRSVLVLDVWRKKIAVEFRPRS